MKRYVSVALMVIVPLIVCAQNQGVLTGRVIDKQSGEDLPGVNVFLKKINKGTATNEKGEYKIKNIPKGKYEVCASCLGYTIGKKEIICNGKSSVCVNFKISRKNESLQQVNIVAKSEARKLRERATPVSVISMDQLAGTVSNVNEILAKTAGVKIRTQGGVGSASRISVRGLEGKRIGFFIDEEPIADNNDFVDLNDIPVDLIERIEVYKGVVPAKFGGSAVGGAVNLVLKEFPESYVDLCYRIKSFNTHDVSAVVKKNKPNSNYEFGIGGFYTYSDNDYEMDSPYTKGLRIKREHDKFEKRAVGAGITAKNWYFDEVVIEPFIVKKDKEIQGIRKNIQHANKTTLATAATTKLKKEDFLFAGLDFDCNTHFIYSVFEFEDISKVRYDWDGSTQPSPHKLGGEINEYPNDSKDEKYTLSNKINLNYIINGWSSVNLNSVFSYTRSYPKNELKNEALGRQTTFNSDMNSWVLGLSYDINSRNDKLLNSLSIKYYNYKMKTTVPGQFGAGEVIPVDLDKSDFGISNALRYRFNKSFLAKASFGYEVRLPSEKELLGDGFKIIASGDLKPEKNTSFNFGFMYDKAASNSRLQLEWNVFYMYLEDMIRFVGGPIHSNYMNFGEMRTIGMDFDLKWDALSWLYLYGNATYQDLRDVRKMQPGSDTPNPTKDERMPNIPYFYANAGLELHKENLLGGSGTNSRIYLESSFVEEFYNTFKFASNQEDKIPQALSFDLGMEYSFKNQKYILGFKIENLTDEKLVSEFNYPLPGRMYSAKLRYVIK